MTDWNPETLAAERTWMRALARRLVGDAGDDLVQEAMVVALDRGEQPSRGWLAGVVRNLSRQRWRGERRRADREERAARPESVADATEALERLEGQRLVAEELAAVDEPFRTALLLGRGLHPGVRRV